MSTRAALVIGNGSYEDPGLADLAAPLADVRALAETLRDPSAGAFQVTELVDEPESVIRRALVTFFHKRHPDDLLLLYFSGHGLLDERGQLYLACRDTYRSILRGTAIPAGFVSDDMDQCRSRRQILILDCCNSGAFARGAKGPASAVTQSTFEGNGYGRAVLTASSSTEFAFEGDQVLADTDRSLFTHFLLEGIRTGAADGDRDGVVSLDEWYEYAYGEVITRRPSQNPQKWVYRQVGDLVIARSPNPPAVEAPPGRLPDELLASLKDVRPWVREGAVIQLGRLLNSSDPEEARAARAALEPLREDDSASVRRALGELLAAPVGASSAPDTALPTVGPADEPGAPTLAGGEAGRVSADTGAGHGRGRNLIARSALWGAAVATILSIGSAIGAGPDALLLYFWIGDWLRYAPLFLGIEWVETRGGGTARKVAGGLAGAGAGMIVSWLVGAALARWGPL